MRRTGVVAFVFFLFSLALLEVVPMKVYGDTWSELEQAMSSFESLRLDNLSLLLSFSVIRFTTLTSYNGTYVLLIPGYRYDGYTGTWGVVHSYAPIVNREGRGDLLLFPFFYTDSSVKTKIRVVNVNSDWGIVAKVVLRSSKCSEELRDFLIYLSPNDVWTAEILLENGKVVLKSTDDSVVVPANHKVASESNPFVVTLRKPANPDDVNNFGYLEVMALAKVNWNWSDGSKTFQAIARKNGFDSLHEFMYYLYNPSDPYLYRSLAYCPGANGRLGPTFITGLIVPFAYDDLTVDDAWYDVNCDGNPDDVVFPMRAPLYGTAEVVIPGGYAAYRAVAVDGFVALGTELKVCDSEEYPCRVTFAETHRNPSEGVFSYKVGAAIDTPLNYVGLVDMLDAALLKREIHVPYYDPDDNDSCGSFTILFSPTMQTRYGYERSIDKHVCVTQPNITSTIWTHVWNDVLAGTLGIAVHSFDNSEHHVSCEFSPCLMKPYELYYVGPVEDIFDPYAYSEGWIKLLLPRVRFESVQEYDCDEGKCAPEGDPKKVLVGGLPVIPLAGFYNSEGVTFIEPSCTETYILPESEETP